MTISFTDDCKSLLNGKNLKDIESEKSFQNWPKKEEWLKINIYTPGIDKPHQWYLDKDINNIMLV